MKTLRQWAGIKMPTAIDPARTALVVVDFQREYFDGKLPIPDGERALAAAQRLVCAADQQGMKVIHVHHVAAAPSAPLFSPGSVGVEPMMGMVPAERHEVVIKRMPSSFAGTNLLELLKGQGCERVIVCGLMTHNCVDATVRDALHLGFAPIVAADACATRDLPGAAGGQAVSARDVHAAVLAGLADRIADVMTSVQILALLGEGNRP